MNAMILAAGYGTRLRPYSLSRPKPLFPVLGIPLLKLHINCLLAAGAAHIVVNSHHLTDLVENEVSSMKNVSLQKEENILGTGGGIRRALPELGRKPFLVVNSDIFYDLDLSVVYNRHCVSDADVTMVLHDYPRFNSVGVSEEGLVSGFGDTAYRMKNKFAFTGIHVIDPDVIKMIPPNSFCNIIELYRSVIEQGGKVRGYLVDDLFWTDIGTPEDYLALHADLFSGRAKGMGITTPGGPVFVDIEVQMGENVRFSDWVCIGKKARIGNNVALARTVVWDGAEIPDGARISDAIVT